MEQDKWIQQLRDKLDGYEADVPEGLWEGIETTLQKQNVLPVSESSRTRRPRFIYLRRWAVAASVVVCLAGGGYWWWSQQDQPQNPVAQEIIAQRHQEDRPLDSVQSPEETAIMANTATVPSPNSSCGLGDEASPQTPSNESDTPKPSYKSEPEVAPSKPSYKEEKDDVATSSEATPLIQEESGVVAQLTPRHRRLPTLGVYSINGTNNYMSSNGVEMSEQKANSYRALTASSTSSIRGRDIIYLASFEEHQRHDRPLSVGLSISYPLSDRLFVTSGAVVTWLHSEFENIIRDQAITRNQQLVYLGIPLSVNYRLWQHKGLKLYALAGGQADWNVSADTDTNGVKQEINKDRMQWSVHAGAGLEFCPIPLLGLYAEPGIKYYFDNGSNVQNYFKDKPLNLNVQLGIRINF